MTLRATWIDRGRNPKHPPDPAYPDGKPIDASHGAAKTCEINLTCPAKRIGYWLIKCDFCDYTLALTTAGRPDDPKWVRVACLNQE